MNIPDEVTVAADDMLAEYPPIGQDAAYQVIADWARKEALRKAASEHFRQSLAAGMGDPTAVAEWLRALAEGDTNA